MWKTKRDFQRKIKQEQKKMYQLSRTKGLGHPEVYHKSCEIDDLIVEFMKKYKSGVNIKLF